MRAIRAVIGGKSKSIFMVGGTAVALWIFGSFYTYMSARLRVQVGLLMWSVSPPPLHDHEGTAVAQWLRCCATNRKVAGSIADVVTGIFHWHNPSDRTMSLGSTQPLTEIVPGGFPGGKCGRCVRLTTLPPPCGVVMKSGNLNFLEPSGPLQACNRTDLLYFTYFKG